MALCFSMVAIVHSATSQKTASLLRRDETPALLLHAARPQRSQTKGLRLRSFQFRSRAECDWEYRDSAGEFIEDRKKKKKKKFSPGEDQKED